MGGRAERVDGVRVSSILAHGLHSRLVAILVVDEYVLPTTPRRRTVRLVPRAGQKHVEHRRQGEDSAPWLSDRSNRAHRTMPIILEYVCAGYGLPGVLGGASTGNGKDRVPRSQVPGISAPLRDLTAEDFKMRGIPGFAK